LLLIGAIPEWTAGPHLTKTEDESAKRQARFQEVEAMLEPIRSTALLHEATGGWWPQSPTRAQTRNRLADLLIAATAHANGLDPYTRNGRDFAGLEDFVRVVVI
jgi:predicted nucleic acid-binding protein